MAHIMNQSNFHTAHSQQKYIYVNQQSFERNRLAVRCQSQTQVASEQLPFSVQKELLREAHQIIQEQRGKEYGVYNSLFHKRKNMKIHTYRFGTRGQLGYNPMNPIDEFPPEYFDVGNAATPTLEQFRQSLVFIRQSLPQERQIEFGQVSVPGFVEHQYSPGYVRAATNAVIKNVIPLPEFRDGKYFLAVVEPKDHLLDYGASLNYIGRRVDDDGFVWPMFLPQARTMILDMDKQIMKEEYKVRKFTYQDEVEEQAIKLEQLLKQDFLDAMMLYSESKEQLSNLRGPRVVEKMRWRHRFEPNNVHLFSKLCKHHEVLGDTLKLMVQKRDRRLIGTRIRRLRLYGVPEEQNETYEETLQLVRRICGPILKGPEEVVHAFRTGPKLEGVIRPIVFKPSTFGGRMRMFNTKQRITVRGVRLDLDITPQQKRKRQITSMQKLWKYRDLDKSLQPRINIDMRNKVSLEWQRRRGN